MQDIKYGEAWILLRNITTVILAMVIVYASLVTVFLYSFDIPTN